MRRVRSSSKGHTERNFCRNSNSVFMLRKHSTTQLCWYLYFFTLPKQDSLRLGYQHQFQRSVAIDLNDPVAGTLSGNYRQPYIDVLALQYDHAF
jgi:hypothetical protein